MESDNKFWLAVIALVGLQVVLLVGICSTNYLLERKFAFQAGYCQTSAAGVGHVVWQKCEAK